MLIQRMFMILACLGLVSPLQAAEGGADVGISYPLPKLSIEGYADFLLSYLDYPANFYRSRSRDDKKVTRVFADLTKLDLGIGMHLPAEFLLYTEFEFLHGGFADENDPNFLGSFADGEGNHQKSGGVLINEIYILKEIHSSFKLFLGRLPVALGFISGANKPSDYLGAAPSEMESHLIPTDWTEMGISVQFKNDAFEATTQLVNGLDSSGFSSRTWVADGRQGRYGAISFTDPALVERLDFRGIAGLTIGSSIYRGDSARNRPTSDLGRPCDALKGAKETAPCGYIHTPLTIIESHIAIDEGDWQGHYMYLAGRMSNTKAINVANRADSSNLPDRYTPVARAVFGSTFELGYSIIRESNFKLEPFVRLEHYNTMYRPAEPRDASSLFERKVSTLGVDCIFRKQLYIKGDLTHRVFGDSKLGQENAVEVGTGVFF